MANIIRKGEIYVISNIINDKKYIGQTILGYKTRLIQHRCRARNIGKYNGHCWALYNAFRKYGEDKFFIDVIDTIDVRLDDKGKKIKEDADKLDELEVMYIKKYNSLSPNGYNLLTGGKNGKYCYESLKRREETRTNTPEISPEERQILRAKIIKEAELKKENRKNEKIEASIRYDNLMKEKKILKKEKIELNKINNSRKSGHILNGICDDTYRENVSESGKFLKAHDGSDLPMYIRRRSPDPKHYQGEGYVVYHPNDNGRTKNFTS